MTESEVFLVGSQFHQMVAIRFVGMLFLIWVGFRLANGIRSSSDSNIIMKVAGSVFVLTVAFFYLFVSGMTEMMNNGMAGMLQNIAEGGTSLSEGAKSFIANNDPGAEFSLIPNIASGLFILSVLVIQLGSIWMPKQD